MHFCVFEAKFNASADGNKGTHFFFPNKNFSRNEATSIIKDWACLPFWLVPCSWRSAAPRWPPPSSSSCVAAAGLGDEPGAAVPCPGLREVPGVPARAWPGPEPLAVPVPGVGVPSPRPVPSPVALVLAGRPRDVP